jgi:hypothetical protein
VRIHATHQVIAPWSVGEPVLDPERLAAVRVEPVFRQRRPALVLDLYLAGETGATVIPLVLVDPAVVVDRDRDPLIFPRGTPGGPAFALALAELILPHLERLVLGDEGHREKAIVLRATLAFAAARAAGCFGAAPLRESLVRLAPFAYARRFARSHTVRIDAPDAVGGWALLRDGSSASVAAGRATPAELAWYGTAPVSSGRTDVAIVAGAADAGDAACILRLDPAGAGTAFPVVDPVPLDVGISFDAAEGPPRRWFAVERAPEPPARSAPDVRYRPAGGSSGRIAVILARNDGPSIAAADTDEALALVAALAGEGFDAVLARSLAELDRADLIHLIGTRDGRRARAIVDLARRAAIPVAVHAHDEDAAGGGWWGAEVARYCFEYGDDERAVRLYLQMLARRAVAVGSARADEPYAPASAGVDDAAAALRDASVVFAATAAEADGIRARTGRRGPVVIVPPLAAVAAPEPIGAHVGSDPFVLVHAPIGPTANQLLVARCAADAAIPLVIAGPVADASYLERVREFGGSASIVLAGEPSLGIAAGLRAAAAVVVDAAWIGEGGSRLAAGALAGARLAVAAGRHFEAAGLAPRRFDPADAAALTRALGEAWDEALRAPGRCAPETVAALAPGAVVRAIVRGYAVHAAAGV